MTITQEAPKGLSADWIAENVNAVTEGDVECDYCGITEGDGDFTFTVEDGVVLCQLCIEDESLGACGHSRTCDCIDGYCE